MNLTMGRLNLLMWRLSPILDGPGILINRVKTLERFVFVLNSSFFSQKLSNKKRSKCRTASFSSH